ncbi:MAG: hypothetical protein IJ489_09150 [Clostridia bacterium]|nr:hypothetical protein [Clostridia bacterium]
MKKLLALILASALSLVLISCTATGDTTNDKLPSENNETSGNTQGEITISEQVIFDKNGIKVTAKGLNKDGFWGPEIKLLIENSSSESIGISAEHLSVNGMMMDNIFSEEIASGKKANSSISFYTSALEEADITIIKDIEFILNIYNSHTYETILRSDPICLTTSADTSFVQTFDSTGTVAYDANDIKVIVRKLNSSESFWGADVYLYIENNSTKNIIIQANDVSINGFMIEPYFSCDIIAGKKALDTITFMETDLEENNIIDITDIELTLRLIEMDSWETLTESDSF